MFGLVGLKKADEDFKAETRRRFLFDDRALRAGGQGHQLFMEEEPPEQDMNDVVDVDDRQIETFVSQELVGNVIESGFFKAFIFILIVINSILIALQTDDAMSVKYRYMFSIFDQMVMATFVCEILLKWYYGFFVFWKAGWNILDFVIIAALLLGPQLSFLSSSRILRILRVLRAFRSLRSVSALAGLSLVVQTILQSIPDMANIVLLLVIVLMVFAVSGVTLFGTIVPARFGDLQTALFSLFICVTQDGWVDIYNEFKTQGGWVHVGGMLYFFCSIMIGAFVFANLVVAVVVTNLEMAMNILRNQKLSYVDALLADDQLELKEDVNIVNQKSIDKDPNYELQNPLQFVDLSTLAIDDIIKYQLLLIALEENVLEYGNIRKDLDMVHGVVAALNMEDIAEDVTPSRSTHRRLTSLDLQEVAKGDILSGLMKLEENSMLDSRNKQNMHAVLHTIADDKPSSERMLQRMRRRSSRKRSKPI